MTDIAPTVFEAVGIKAPDEVDGVKQIPLEGKSFVDSFTDAKAKSRHTQQVFEMLGNRGIYKDGWWAGARHIVPWKSFERFDEPIGQHPWELYNLEKDYSQAHDLAKENPEKLKELVQLFDEEAKRNNIYPLAPIPALLTQKPEKKQLVLHEGASRIPELTGPRTTSRSHTITADIEVPQSGAKGVVVTEGGRLGGYAIYLDEKGRVVYETSAQGHASGRIVSADPLQAGKATITLDFNADGDDANPVVKVAQTLGRAAQPGTARLSVNGAEVGAVKISDLSTDWHETLDVGADYGTSISDNYAVPFKFTGKIKSVTLDLK